MKTVILCGGKGTRMDSMTAEAPKPLAIIGDKPVLWHIMKIYSCFGFNEFVLCLGYKGEKIREYFKENSAEKWEIDFVETGEASSKSERIKMVEGSVGERFFLAYGDDLSDVNIDQLLRFHEKNKQIGTVTAVKLESPFGIMKIDNRGMINDFVEKPVLDHWVNGGFMVFEKKIYDYLGEGELEQEVFNKLVQEKQLSAFRHFGKWKSMNTLKDNIELNELWAQKKAFWKVWK